jgi:hypothetical protein
VGVGWPLKDAAVHILAMEKIDGTASTKKKLACELVL